MARDWGDWGRGALRIAYVYAAISFVDYCVWSWRDKVVQIVPEPYLDEVFHVRQAQVYCSGDFTTWDPKITTPPGLYILSYLARNHMTYGCGILSLRAVGVTFLTLLGPIVYVLLARRQYSTTSNDLAVLADSLVGARQNALKLAHATANICLFPPLFFFAPLYYTDVPSLFVVLLALLPIGKYSNVHPVSVFGSLYYTVLYVPFGLLALSFRQTNIFWVAVFPAALSVISLAQRSGVKSKVEYASSPTLFEVYQKSWENGLLYDPPVEEALVEDYAKTALSILVIASLHVKTAILVTLPYMVLLISFLAFVIWNGGVVLGDKSNHVATVHLPQMLYLWPYMLFFSFPTAISPVLGVLYSLSSRGLEGMKRNLPRGYVLAQLSFLAAIVVHFNTIVHPFTLADNRHYVFYVFRILLRHPATKYIAAPVYVACGYLVIQALGDNRIRPDSKWVVAAREKEGRDVIGKVTDDLTESSRASFVLAWLATTTLSLITAPLVEPRYCIIPWIMWRVHVPLHRATILPAHKNAETWLQWLLRMLQQDSSKLLIETVWFCCINVVTGYFFLYRGFEWPQEPDKIQRFMW